MPDATTLVLRDLAHQREWGEAMAAGLRRHAVAVTVRDVRTVDLEKLKPGDVADRVAVCWGWKIGRALRAAGHEVLVMERGYIGDRMAATSLGWNGLNGRATFPVGDDDVRASVRFGVHLSDWRAPLPGDRALLCGQVPGDMALEPLGSDIAYKAWLADARRLLEAAGWTVTFRPHPMVSHLSGPTGGSCAAPLSADLAGAGLAVAYNSNALTEAAIAGVPVQAGDCGAIAWPVCGNRLGGKSHRPYRSAWLRDVAARQFTKDEFESGYAWERARAGLADGIMAA